MCDENNFPLVLNSQFCFLLHKKKSRREGPLKTSRQLQSFCSKFSDKDICSCLKTVKARLKTRLHMRLLPAFLIEFRFVSEIFEKNNRNTPK